MIFKIYTDGSYRDGIWGAGAIVLNEQNAMLFTVKESGADATKFRNAGEVMAVEKALRELFKNYKKKADKNKEKLSVTICYNYEGVQKWADGEWKANKKITIAYKECIANARKVMDINFKAHSGDKFDSLANELAKQALDDADATIPAENVSSTSTATTVAVEGDDDTITIKVVFSRKELEAEYTPETLEETLKANLPVKEVIF